MGLLVDKNYNIKLTTTELQYIGQVLGDRPHKEVNLLLNNLQTQINEQDASPKEA